MHENRHILEKKKQELQQLIFAMSGMATEAISQVTNCLNSTDCDKAEAIIRHDQDINEKFHEAESTAVFIIASQQPVAIDLREVVAAMRISAEIERIADHAANVAAIRLQMGQQDLAEVSLSAVSELGAKVLAIYNHALEAYQKMDVEMARKTQAMEEEIDGLIEPLTNALFDKMKASPDSVEDGSRMLWISHNFERIADRATNIAEQVVYVITANEESLN